LTSGDHGLERSDTRATASRAHEARFHRRRVADDREQSAPGFSCSKKRSGKIGVEPVSTMASYASVAEAARAVAGLDTHVAEARAGEPRARRTPAPSSISTLRTTRGARSREAR
jgi:hypothetical protein